MLQIGIVFLPQWIPVEYLAPMPDTQQVIIPKAAHGCLVA